MTNRILNGDVISGLRAIPDGLVQTVITSPPYWNLRDYGVEGQIGLEKRPEDYVGKLVEVFREVRRVLRDDGTVWLNIGDSYATGTGMGKNIRKSDSYKYVDFGDHGEGYPDRSGWKETKYNLKYGDMCGIPWRVALALQDDGWFLRSDIIWSKLNPMPSPVVNRPVSSHEYVFLLTKNKQYYYDWVAVRENTHNLRSVWNIPTSPNRDEHFAVFPQQLVEPCIKAGTSETGACSICGKPYKREIEIERRDTKTEFGKKDETAEGFGQSGGTYLEITRINTIGWKPDCEHKSGTIPCVVLDPFAGSFTTALVARNLHRESISIELNKKYVDLGIKRLRINQQLPSVPPAWEIVNV